MKTMRARRRVRAPVVTLLGLILILALGAFRVPDMAGSASLGIVSGLSLAWGDSTVLAQWNADSGAVGGYLVSLVRAVDDGIMEQKQVPPSQLAFDAQGIWPGEQYFVAVQPVDASGTPGAATLSAPGQSVPISRTTYNGFLDQENRAAGQIDTNLWDEHIFYSNVAMYGDTFVNGQLHYHLQAGCPPSAPCADQQTITVQNARVPIDWTNRTATIHGEVDLKGDFHQWFGAVLTPQIIGPDRVLDRVDRMFMPVTMPQLEIFTFEGETDLIYARGDGSQPSLLAHIPNPRGYNNVRDDIVWHVSATHTTILIDGKTAFDLDWPAPLGFTHGYLSLFAEDYPNSGGTNGQPACDQAPAGDCSVWHLDNWGFDAPAGQVQSTTAAFYAQGCGPYSGQEGTEVQAVACDLLNTNDLGPNPSVTVPGVTASNLTDAGVVFDVQRLHLAGALTVSVNGNAALPVLAVASDRNTYDFQSYRVDVPASNLVSGTNVVAFQYNSGANQGDQILIANVQIETLSSVPYMPPPLPSEPAPIGTWGGGSPTPTPTPASTSTPTQTPIPPTPAPIPINNVPCTVQLPSGTQSGTCSGTFTPNP